MKRMDRLTISFLFFSILLLIFLVVPLINLLQVNSLGKLLNGFFKQEILQAIGLSLYTGMITAVLSVLFGTPLAYLLATKKFPGKEFLEAIVEIPILLPHIVAGIALLLIIGQHGLIGRPLSFLGIQFTRTILGIIAAQFFVSSPFYIRSAEEGFKSIDPNLRKVARCCGASPSKTFLEIELPLCARAMFSGAILTWARAISEFSAVLIISSYPLVAPILVYEYFLTKGFYASLIPAALLEIVSLGIFALLKVIQTRSFWSYS